MGLIIIPTGVKRKFLCKFAGDVVNLNDMHGRPRPRGYKYVPFIPTKVKVSTIIANIESGKYDVRVFYTDTNSIVNAPVVSSVCGPEAIPLAIQLLNKWADTDGKVQKCLLSTKKGILHQDLLGYSNLYSQLHSRYHELVALVKKQ